MLGILQHIDVVAAFGPKKATFGGNYPWAGSILLNIAIHIAIIVIILQYVFEENRPSNIITTLPFNFERKTQRQQQQGFESEKKLLVFLVL